MELTKGFYIVDGLGTVKTKIVKTKALGEVEVPIRLRTFNAARDASQCGDGNAVLAVTADNFAWGE